MAISYGTYTITEIEEGSQIWTSSAAPTTPDYTFGVSHLTGDSDIPIREGDIILNSYYRYTVLSISSDGTTVLTGNRTSIRGATGAASVTYALIVSNLAIVKDKDGNLSPSTITVTAKSQTGSNAMANYTGRIKIETTTNNSTWTSRINEDAATKTYTIPSDTVAIRCSLYLKGGTTTLLDQQTVPVVSDGTDGINGTDGKDAYSIILTNENHTFAGNTTSAIASEIECNVIAYKGATQIAATIGTITGQPTGMTTSLLNNGTVNAAFKVTVTTSMVTRNGVLNVPITVDGKTFTKKFTYSLALKGSTGTSENLLMDVYAPSLTKVDAPWDRYLSEASNTTITGQFIAEANLPDPNATHFYRITDSSASTKGRGLGFYSDGTPPFINGHTYRIGCWVRKHAGSPKMNINLGSFGSLIPAHRIVDNTEWEWIEVIRTFGDIDSDVTTQTSSYKKLYFYFYNNSVAGSSLDMCGFRMEEVQVNSGTARNFLLGTEKLTNWGLVNGTTVSDGIMTFPTITENHWREIYPAKNFKYDLIRNQNTIFSIKVKADSGKKCCINLCVGVDATETAYTRQKYFNQFVYFTGDGEWHTVCASAFITDDVFVSGTGSPNYDDCWVTVRIGAVATYHNRFQAKEPQLCLGTTATSWSRAPEDIDEAIDNIEVGGRNYIPLSKNLKSFTIENSTRATATYTDDSCTIVNTYGDTRYGIYYNVDVEPNSIYTLSFQASNISGTNVNYAVGNRTPNQTASWSDITNGYQNIIDGKNVRTFTIPNTVTVVRIYICVGSLNGTVTISNLKLEKGNKVTDWTPAPEDIEASAVTEEQYIYIQATSGTNSVNPTTTWVTENGESTISDTQGLMPVWTTKRPTYRTNYPVIFIAKQKKTVNGTITCTTPIKDDTLTIIDGGHITTGTIDASKVTVTNIDASKITTGKLNANVIEANSLKISQISGLQTSLDNKQPTGDYATNTGLADAINNIEIGGKNMLRKNPKAKNPSAYGAYDLVLTEPLEANQKYTIQLWDVNISNDKKTEEQLSISVYYCGGAVFLCRWLGTKYFTNGHADYLSLSFTPTEANVSHSDVTNPNMVNKFIRLYNSVPNASGAVMNLTVGKWKLEKGNKATDWTPATEDVEADIEEAKKVATNYLSVDSTGIMVADMQDGEQIPSTATGRNVFIDSDSVDIRDGQNILASFSGDETKFYDSTLETEIASFGISGARIGNKDGQHFMVDSESINAVNEDGSTIFSISSTNATAPAIVTVIDEVRSRKSSGVIYTLPDLNYNTSNTFYIKKLRVEFYTPAAFSAGFWSAPEYSTPSDAKVFYVSPDSTQSTTRVIMQFPEVSFTYGTPITIQYKIKAYPRFKQTSEDVTYDGLILIYYNGDKRLEFSKYKGTWTVSDHTYTSQYEDEYRVYDIMSDAGTMKAPSMTFGTRATDGTIAAFSTTIGEGLYANAPNQLTIGKYNLNNDEFNPLAFAVGNGTDNVDRSNAFSVDWDGDTELSGNLTVAENINVTGRLTSDGNSGLFVLDTASTVISSIGTYAACRGNINITKSGYTPIAIAGFGITGDNGWCVFPRCYITKDESDSTIDYLNFYIWNQNSKVAFNNVTIEVKILYIASSAF